MQAQLLALAHLQRQSLGDQDGQENAPQLDQLAYLFAGSTLQASFVIAEQLLRRQHMVRAARLCM